MRARDMNLEMGFSSDDKTTVIKSDQRTVEIKDNQVKYLKPILKEARVAIYVKMTLDQPWLGQSTTLHWNDPMLSDGTYYILREWKNIPDTVISIYVNISQQLLPTKIYKANKLKETQHDLKGHLCGINNETVPHLMSSCSEIAQSLYKSRHDKMLRPVYHHVLHKYSFESEVSKPWYQQEMPKPAKENKRVKVFWDIPIYVDKAPENGANRLDMVILDKINKNWIIIEGTVCLIGEITEREKLKSSKYRDLREALKRLYPGYTVQQLNIVLDYLGHKQKLLDYYVNPKNGYIARTVKSLKNFILMTLVKEKTIVVWDRMPSLGETIYIKKTQGTFDIDSFIKEEKKIYLHISLE